MAFELRAIPCPLCGAEEFDPLVKRGDELMIAKCRRCGLAHLNPSPTAESVGQLYERGYYDGDSGKAVGYSAYKPTVLGTLAYSPWGWELLTAERPLAGLRALDIGCAYGRMVTWLSRAGAKATGIDLSAEGVAWGSKHLGLDLRQTSLEALDVPPESFDLVTMMDLIEHVVGLGAFMEKLAAVVRQGGLVLVQTPNFRTYETWGQEAAVVHFALEHVLYFEVSTLDALFARHGFSPARPTTVYHTIPMDRETFRLTQRQAPRGLRQTLSKLPGYSLLQWLKSRLRPVPRIYRTDPTGREGAAIVGLYRKA